MRLVTGSRLGPYEVVAPIGHGGMGEVFRARDTRLGRDVALKVLPEAAHGDAERFQRFEREARAAGALNHPNVVVLHDVGSQDGAPYLVSELLEGETLREQAPARTPFAAARRGDRGAGRPGARRRAREGDRPPRPEARERLPDGRRARQDPRLRPRQAPRPGVAGERKRARAAAADGLRRRRRHGRLHGSGAGAGRGRRREGRRLRDSGPASTRCSRAGGPSAPARRRRRWPRSCEKSLPTSRRSGGASSPQLDRIVRRCLEKQKAARFQSARDLAFALESLSGTRLAAGPGLLAGLVPWRIAASLRRATVPLATLVAGALAGALLMARLRRAPGTGPGGPPRADPLGSRLLARGLARRPARRVLVAPGRPAPHLAEADPGRGRDGPDERSGGHGAEVLPGRPVDPLHANGREGRALDLEGPGRRGRRAAPLQRGRGGRRLARRDGGRVPPSPAAQTTGRRLSSSRPSPEGTSGSWPASRPSCRARASPRTAGRSRSPRRGAPRAESRGPSSSSRATGASAASRFPTPRASRRRSPGWGRGGASSRASSTRASRTREPSAST